MKKQKQASKPTTDNSKVNIDYFRWGNFSLKLLVLLASIVMVVGYTDKKGYFTSDQSNNHVYRKWASFYKFTKTKKVDIVILGNSHVITGLDPFILSIATGTNCFILGNSGTSIADAYFQLGEALIYTTPKLVILETYCIRNTEKASGSAIPQIQSFEAHQNIPFKLKMMPELFQSDCWVKAWSPSIRNHSFLLTDMDRIKYNIDNPTSPLPQRLDLGRFARFDRGLEENTLTKYDSLGAPVKGREYAVSEHSKTYVKKIMDLCASKKIPVLLLTVPMYYKHIDDYEIWKSTLGKELGKYPAPWLDLQQPYDSTLFTPDAFENTYAANQHLSNYGMNVVAYKVAYFLFKNNYKLPDRSKDKKWIADFHDQPHYIFNQEAPSGTPGYTTIIKDKGLGKIRIKEMIMQEMKDVNRLIVKVDNSNNSLPSDIEASLIVQHASSVFITPVQLYSLMEVIPPRHKVYVADLRKDVTVLDIKEIR